MIVALRRRYLDSTSSFHPSAASSSSGCLPRICRACPETVPDRLIVSHQTNHVVEQIPRLPRFQPIRKGTLVLSRIVLERISTSARLVSPTKAPLASQLEPDPAGWSPPARSCDRPNGYTLQSRRRPLPPHDSSAASQTVDFPTPELPVTHTNGIDKSSHEDSGHPRILEDMILPHSCRCRSSGTPSRLPRHAQACPLATELGRADQTDRGEFHTSCCGQSGFGHLDHERH